MHNSEPSLSRKTEKYVEFAHQHIIATGLEVEAPLLFEMKMTILASTDEIGFITSDTPCVWFNPNLYKMPPFYRHPGLIQKDIEVTLPLTPNHTLLISHTEQPAYVDANEKTIDEINRRTRFHCYEEFVSWRGETRPYWFDAGKEPEDSWEKSAKGREAVFERNKALDELNTLADLGNTPGTIPLPPTDDINGETKETNGMKSERKTTHS